MTTTPVFQESLRATLLRTGMIALVLGAVIAQAWGGGWGNWPRATLLALWPALGGHFIEIWFLEWVRPRVGTGRVALAMARLAVWFLAGVVLLWCMQWTAAALGTPRRVAWWVGGIAYVCIELVAHLVLQLRGRGSFYNGRG